MKVIYTKKGEEIFVDDEDYEILNKRKWHSHKSSSSGHHLSVVTTLIEKGKSPRTIYMHQYIFPWATIIDHIDGNPFNNQKSNLRLCSHLENSRNRKIHRNNQSGYKGVYRVRDKWRAQIRLDKKLVNIGYFLNKEDAAKAYNECARKYFGEFARLNILKGGGQ